MDIQDHYKTATYNETQQCMDQPISERETIENIWAAMDAKRPLSRVSRGMTFTHMPCKVPFADRSAAGRGMSLVTVIHKGGNIPDIANDVAAVAVRPQSLWGYKRTTAVVRKNKYFNWRSNHQGVHTTFCVRLHLHRGMRRYRCVWPRGLLLYRFD